MLKTSNIDNNIVNNIDRLNAPSIKSVFLAEYGHTLFCREMEL